MTCQLHFWTTRKNENHPSLIVEHALAFHALHFSSEFCDVCVCIWRAMSLWCLSKTFPCIFVFGISIDSAGLWVSETLPVAMAMPHCNTASGQTARCSVDARTVSVAGETCWMLISPSTVCPSSDHRNTLDLHYTLSVPLLHNAFQTFWFEVYMSQSLSDLMQCCFLLDACWQMSLNVLFSKNKITKFSRAAIQICDSGLTWK